MKNLYIYVALASSLLVFAISYFVVLSKLIVTKKNLSKIYVDNFALEQYIKLLQDSKSNSTDQEVHKENFLKFLSDSRDWAFEYIEKSQQIIKEVSDELKVKGLDNYSEKLLALLPEMGQGKK